MTLLSVPNVSEGRDQDDARRARRGVRPGLSTGPRDADHHRAVFTLVGSPGELHQQVLKASREAIERVDLTHHAGVHPRVGAVDVAPIVYLDAEDKGAACAEALVLADEIGRLGIPVYLYGELAGGRTRAELRKPGGLDHLHPRLRPTQLHPTAGATLVAARPPLVAFNVEIDAPLEHRESDRQAPERRARRPSARPPTERPRPGLDQHRGPHAKSPPRKWSPRSDDTPESPAPSSSRPPREPRSQTSPKTCRSAARRRWKII